MSGLFDDKPITFACPKCATKHTQTLGWIKANDQLVCTCGATIHLDRDQLIQALETVESQLAKLPRKITFKL